MNILTFDIEEWFHIKFDVDFLDDTRIDKYENRIDNNVEYILDTLENYQVYMEFQEVDYVLP